MREKIIEIAIAWADEYDSRDPLQMSKLVDAIIAALREQEPAAEVNAEQVLKWSAPDYGGSRKPGTKLYALPIPPVEQASPMTILGEQERVETETETVVLGIPPHSDAWAENDPRQHNCDAMGCGRAHVLARIPKFEQTDSGQAVTNVGYKQFTGTDTQRAFLKKLTQDNPRWELDSILNKIAVSAFSAGMEHRAALSEQQPGEKS